MRDENDASNRPVPGGFTSWNAYWASQGMPWRTEPEIDADQQRFLTERRAIRGDIEQGVYPFRDTQGDGIKLTRAQVEWLLATHVSAGEVGPVDWDKATHRERKGLDLRGANLDGEDLRRLPLTALQAGLSRAELLHQTANYAEATEEYLAQALAKKAAGSAYGVVSLKGTNLSEADLRGSVLTDCDLRGAQLYRACLESADLSLASMEHANLVECTLGDATLQFTNLRGADMVRAQFTGGSVRDSKRSGALASADLRGAVFSPLSTLHGAILGSRQTGCALVADVQWGDIDLAVVNWTRVTKLGDEWQARRATSRDGKRKPRWARRLEYEAAARANRQVATVLRNQGLNEHADRFAYRAQVLQRTVLRLQGRRLAAAGSWLLDFISGYGYEPLRSLATYVIVILGFAVAYRLLGNQVYPPLGPLDAVVFSVTSFHGRGFSPGEVVTLHNPLTVLAAFEAVIGLLIEITFIATFTQRFFAR